MPIPGFGVFQIPAEMNVKDTAQDNDTIPAK